jgi:hypothetical protein
LRLLRKFLPLASFFEISEPKFSKISESFKNLDLIRRNRCCVLFGGALPLLLENFGRTAFTLTARGFCEVALLFEIDQWMPVRLLAQNRKVPAKSSPVNLARDSFMHPIICSTPVVSMSGNMPDGAGKMPALPNHFSSSFTPAKALTANSKSSRDSKGW